MTKRLKAKHPASKAVLVLTGAGEGRRMSGIDKVFAPLGGHPVVYWPLLAAQKSDLISAVVLVLSPQNIDRGRDLAYGSRFDKVMEVCLGGATRQESVHIGLSKLPECEWVIIHDAARPFLDGTLIEDGLRAAEETGAAIAAVPVKDTIKVAGLDGLIVQTPRRDGLWAAQTPQIFRFDIISEAYKSSDEATDDASLVERAGGQVKLYAGSYENIKITTPEDLAYAELLLKKRAPCA